MNKRIDNYYIGFDIGTDSVGWAVTDQNYNILKFNGKAMWGVRLFDEAKTAAERRLFRTSRRRLQRRKWRIELLQEIFDKEICAADSSFFQRLEDSYLKDEDRRGVSWTFFNDEGFNDKDYYKKYPTIYHLRHDLMHSSEKHDVRLLYLALHHIIKYRGHFLIEGDISAAPSFNSVFDPLKESLTSRYEVDLSCVREDEIEKVLSDRSLSVSGKKAALRKMFSPDKKDELLIKIADMISGCKVNICEIAETEGKLSLAFSDSDYEQKRIEAEELGEDACDIIDKAKVVYDWSILTEILDGEDSLSKAKVKVYEKHRRDLALLKKIIKENLPGEYKKVFASKTGDYARYVGHENGEKRINDAVFYSDLKKLLAKCERTVSPDAEYILKEIENNRFLPLQTNKDNGVIPHQVHWRELTCILDNAEKYSPFLSEKDENGMSARQKIEAIFKFRIPYYVGPLNDTHKNSGGHCWIVRKEPGAITPWNFHKKVNEEQSAECFITRMTSKCSYLAGENVLPKNSLLYSDFMVLNELNNVRIDNEPLPVPVKIKIFDELFSQKNKVSLKALTNFLKKEGLDVSLENITGIDDGFKSSRCSYIDFKNKIFKGEDKLKEYPVRLAVERIIAWITIYGDSNKFLKGKIKTHYKDIFSDEQIEAVCRLKYTGWGRLSERLLTGIEGAYKESGEIFSIINALKNTPDNFMQLLSYRYTFTDEIERYNAAVQNIAADISYESLLQDAYIAPSVKKAVWQTITISEEIKKIMGKEPEKIFIEMARGDKNAKKGNAGRTKSRKSVLTELYRNIENEYRYLWSELENTEERALQSKKLYLYFTQLGKCMYSGERIELSELLANNSRYDKDHIYPRSKTKDDSFDNLVLVKKEINARKSNEIISEGIRNKMRPFWSELLNKKLISKEKFNRLTRRSPLSDEELAGFINRQLVETRQSTKAAADIFKRIYDKTDVIYVKSQIVSDFRQEYGFIKVRSVNDYHHAKDAYLNIVAGNVYDAKFTKNPLKWLRGNGNTDYNLCKLFDKDVNGKNGIVWKADNSDGQSTIETVKKFLDKNNIIYTRHSIRNKAGLFNQQIVGENPSVPIKAGMDLKYGGYKGIAPAYFSLVVSDDKKGVEKQTVEAVPLYLKDKFEKNPNEFLKFCEDEYGLKNPRVKVACIKISSLFKIDGFPMHLNGKSGDSLVMQIAVQLCLDKNLSEYVKKIERFMEKRKINKELTADEKYDGISFESNERLFQELLNKSKNNIYINRPAKQTDTFAKGFDKFKSLSAEEQCGVLTEMLKLFVCKSYKANLKEIGGSQNAGNVTINKNMARYKKALLINQSPTGLFENTVDLLKV